MTDEDIKEIRQAFAIECGELLIEMESALLALEASTSDSEEFNRLFRTIHTIKGSASIVGFEAAERFCHSIEHILVLIREGNISLNDTLVALFLRCHDHLNTMMELFCQESDTPDFFDHPVYNSLLEKLNSDEWVCGATDSNRSYDQLDVSYLDSAEDEGFGFFPQDETAPLSAIDHPSNDLSLQQDQQISREAGQRDQRVVRVDAQKLDQLSDMIVELVTASSVLEADIRRLKDSQAMESATHLSDLIKHIQEKSMVFRMVPVHTLFRRFQRIIHDIGKSSGKNIRLTITGGETELDKVVVEKLHEPLLHLVRNAVDHGMETEAERIAAGKPRTGTIGLSACHEAGSIIITVEDDGQGINLAAIASKATERGLLKRGETATRKEIINCMFEPGFSTLDEATMLSGRGVGMDVVRKTVESLRGSIDVECEEGKGTTLRISIPLSLSMVDGFMVSLGVNQYIIPMELLVETLELPDISKPETMTNGCLNVRGTLLPCLDLKQVLETPDASQNIRHIVVVRFGRQNLGLVVDQLLGETKCVIKPLGRLYRNVTCVSGASILGDGSIALLLEISKLAEHGAEASSGQDDRLNRSSTFPTAATS